MGATITMIEKELVKFPRKTCQAQAYQVGRSPLLEKEATQTGEKIYRWGLQVIDEGKILGLVNNGWFV